MNTDLKKRKNEKINPKNIAILKSHAEKKGLSFSTVRRNYLLARDKAGNNVQNEIFVQEYNRLNDLAVERKKKKVAGNANDISICRNAILLAMLNQKNLYCYTGWVAAEFQYEIVKGKEFIRFDIENHEKFAGLNFKQILILSAIYSQLLTTQEKPDFDQRFAVSLRSIYEFMHGSKTKWCMVAVKEKIALRNDIISLQLALNKISGKYRYLKTHISKQGSIKKDFADAEVGYGFFLRGSWVFDPARQEQELEEEKKQGYKNSVFHCRKPPFLEIYENQKRITTIDNAMLNLETEHNLDAMKIYIAFQVVQASKNTKLTKAIRYDTLIHLFGDDHRKMVKRYAKFLEEKGYIKELRLDKDAVRWE